MENDRLLKLVEAYQEHFKQYNRPDYNDHHDLGLSLGKRLRVYTLHNSKKAVTAD